MTNDWADILEPLQEHGGELVAQSDGPDRGSTFEVRLPVSSESANPTEHHAAPAA